MPMKPLGRKAYGSIPHLPASRLGSGDHHCQEGQAVICTMKARDKFDRIIVTEKLDGSCVAVANIGGRIIPLIRAGYHAADAKHEMLRVFATWVENNTRRFLASLLPGDRMIGEWLYMAHGTIYNVEGEPFIPFDVIDVSETRLPHDKARERFRLAGLIGAAIVHDGGPLAIPDALSLLGETGRHGAQETIEGAVWRVERHGAFEFMAKYVRPDKIDGKYIPEISGQPPIFLVDRPASRRQ